MFSFLYGGNQTKTVNFEDIQYAIQYPQRFLLINTLPLYEQDCLIQGTLDATQEETIVNEMITRVDVPDKIIIIYGRNANDASTEKKYKQLRGLGIVEIVIYSGGLFEWLLLQDIYGEKEFPTTRKIRDILKYKSSRQLDCK